MLKTQKRQREEAVDEARGLVEAIQNYSLPNYSSNRLPYRVDVFYRDKLQLSEWLRDRPDDLDAWILVPCPKGKRHIVVAAANKTIAYSKSGTVIDIFQSSFQSGRYLTVLDCIFSEEAQSFYVLDVLIYHNQEFILCDASFRFYWIRSKFDEFDHSAVHRGNQYAFYHIDRADFDHPEEVEGMLGRCPLLWGGEEAQPQLDGFLLYHKLAHYTHGKTPLVGWLLPWMIPEMLGYTVHPEYLKQRPTGSLSALEFMDDFDMKRKLGQQKRRHFFKPKKRNGGGDMEVTQTEEGTGGECSWSENAQEKKMEVQMVQESVEAEDEDAMEELEFLNQRKFSGVNTYDDDEGELDETGMELLDNSGQCNDQQQMTKRSKATNIQKMDHKRISTSVFKF